MKGILAIGLALSLTGTVVSQSFQPDNSLSFGSGNSARPSPEHQADQSFSNLSSINASSSRSQLKYELILDAEIIKKFRIDGELSSQIPTDIRNDVSEIVFGSPAAFRNSSADAPFERLQPYSTENGVLYFEFTEFDLRNVETTTLRYRLLPREIGKIEHVVVRFVNSNSATGNGSFNSPGIERVSPPDQTGSSPTINEINPPTTGQSDFSAGVNSRPFDRGMAGSQIPPTAPNFDRFAANDSRSPINNFGNSSPRPELENGLWQTDPLKSRPIDSNLATTGDLTGQRRAEYLTSMSNELKRREAEIARKEQLWAENQRELSSLFPTESRSTIEAARSQSGQISEGQIHSALTSIAAAINEVKQDNTLLWNRLDSLQNRPNQYSLAQADTGVPQMPSRAEDRISRNLSPNVANPSLADFQTQIPGAGSLEKNNAGQQNMTGPLFFMLCCSLGLNIYLAIVSRNYYVRYDELADELRETFSASVSS